MFPFHCDVTVMSDRSTAVGAGGKAAVIVDNVPGMIMAAPTPNDHTPSDERAGRAGERGRARADGEPAQTSTLD
jgi:hypothetical protein